MSENNEDVNVDYSLQTPKISENEGLKAVVQYFEQQGASQMDLLFCHRLRDEAAKRRVCSTGNRIVQS
ncbi:hypothetical protein TNCV_1989871 [Trichonephila clavipes]|nr:hypothetical protein TNCV_1989871 [Trichonephila clavipes]